MPTRRDVLLAAVERACRRLLSEQNRDPGSPGYGCFDRRYWAWKLVDMPEATFQRGVAPLAWWAARLAPDAPLRPVLVEAISAGLSFAGRIQHRNGSFDQAFPNEQSFGATGFLLGPLIAGYQAVRSTLSEADRTMVENSLRRAAGFLCGHHEAHGRISNHLAGAAASLLACARLFDDRTYAARADELVRQVLSLQSEEGWFEEYGGADPGYQTLAVDYLAAVRTLRPDDALDRALVRSVEFLGWFVHPDGTFGGEYGSRRTAVYYPGGVAALRALTPAAEQMTLAMTRALAEGRSVTLDDIDVANLNPLLSSHLRLLDTGLDLEADEKDLPWQRAEAAADFREAGLAVRARGRWYLVCGLANGGVLKVFDRERRTVAWDDGGYVATDERGRVASTQATVRGRTARVSPEAIEIEAPFFWIGERLPTPAQFVVLRVLNLTVMRSVAVGNLVKRLLVRLLITSMRPAALRLRRRITWTDSRLDIEDELTAPAGSRWREIRGGRPVVGIHMASARYFGGSAGASAPGVIVDADVLRSTGAWRTRVSL